MLVLESRATAAAAAEACPSVEFDARVIFRAQVHLLRDVLFARTEAFVVGPSGSGKSTVWRALARAGVQESVGRAREHVSWQAISPDAMPLRYLLGHYTTDATADTPAGSWLPGYLSNILRNFSAVGKDAGRWLIVDGQV